MATSNQPLSWMKAWPVCFGLVGLLLAGSLAPAQEKEIGGKDQPKDQPKEEQGPPPQAERRPIVAGYTRPGFPDDKKVDGKIRPVAWDDNYKGRMIGGSVYFAVFERSSSPVAGDTFGTGIKNFDDDFKEGLNTGGQFSPGFDTQAKYLYLYQVVNDRGLDPPSEEAAVPIAVKEFRTEDILTTTIKLLVEPRDITSWGSFSKLGFVADVPDRGAKGDIVLAADKMSEKILPVAFSSNTSVLGALPYHEYALKSPAFPLGKLKNHFKVDRSNRNLDNTKVVADLSKLKADKVELVSWQEEMLVASKGGKDPTYVQIVMPDYMQYGKLIADLPEGGQDPEQRAADGPPARCLLKADWRGKNILKLGDHSVVFGFTSNLPPTGTGVRIISPDKEKGKEEKKGAGGGDKGIQFVSLETQGIAAAGSVPSPAPAPAGGGGGGGAWLGGFTPGFTGGGTGGGIGGAGGFTIPAAATGGGGATSGGNGNQNQTPPTQAQDQSNGSNNGTTGNQSQQVSVNVMNQQQQGQQQQQQQKQRQNQNQHQNQHNNNHHHGNVVPEPAAIGLGLLGLPALWWAWRRRRGAATPAAAATEQTTVS